MRTKFTILVMTLLLGMPFDSAFAQIEKNQAKDTTGKSILPKAELTEDEKKELRTRIDRIIEKDQQFRSYLSFCTTDDEEIARVKKLDAKGQLAEMSKNTGNLSEEVRQLLVQLQLKNDRQNWAEFVSIVKEFGYPSPKRIGVETDRIYLLLLHPPVGKEEIEKHVAECEAMMKPEVAAGRFEPRQYASFVDNMRGKILRKPQLYGTNQMFDPATKRILPPQIVDLDLANKLRREIGMEELKPGEYRLAEK